MTTAPSHLWRRLLSPEVLFLLGTAQALFPYVLWSFAGLNVNYHYGLSYIPAAIYVVGYLLFLLGARLGAIAARQTMGTCSVPVFPLMFSLVLVLGAAVVQFSLAVKLYGGIPILNYLKEASDVWEINDLQQDSFMGQLGLLTFTTFFLSAASMLLLVKTTRPNLITTMLVGSCVLLCFLISSMAGKRQGLLMCAFIVCAGVTIRLGDPVRSILRFLGVSNNQRSAFSLNVFTIMVCSIVLLTYLTTLNSLRVGERRIGASFGDVTPYLELPVINFEAQAEAIGFGPLQYAAMPLLTGLLPQKIIDTSNTVDPDNRFYLEPTASAGIYGPLHLHAGIVGCLGFALLLGAFLKFAYLRAAMDDFCLLAYAQCSWALFVAYSFNLFLKLVFVIAPLLSYVLFCGLLILFSRKQLR